MAKVLIACEESQVVCKAFREKGHEAYSCDIIDCSGGHPEWHIKDDVLNHLNDGWDAMIAFPPCTYLTVTANRSFLNNPERWDKRLEAVKFVYKLLKGLPLLKATNMVKPEWIIAPSGKRISKFHWEHSSTKNPKNAKLRSKTFPGIAAAMADQWGNLI